jgi:hypothetical protein
MQNAHEIQMSLTRNFNGKQTSGGRPPLKKAKKKSPLKSVSLFLPPASLLP